MDHNIVLYKFLTTSIWFVFLWLRDQMETFFALLALCEGNPPVTGEFPSQRPVRRGFHVFFNLRLNNRLSKQSRRRWFETTWRQLWRHCNVFIQFPDTGCWYTSRGKTSTRRLYYRHILLHDFSTPFICTEPDVCTHNSLLIYILYPHINFQYSNNGLDADMLTRWFIHLPP